MNLSYERKLWEEGYEFVAGVDEAGRGPLAGPIVAAAVILPKNVTIQGLNDSKKLSPRKRMEVFDAIKKKALAIGIGKASRRLIDKINIGKANVFVMEEAVKALPVSPSYLLIDGKRYKLNLPVTQRCIIGGDGKCASIAAASVVAKVIRDRIMLDYHNKYPEYRFDLHKGYGTRKHFKKLQEHGPCPIHRRSFFPVGNMLKGEINWDLIFRPEAGRGSRLEPQPRL